MGHLGGGFQPYEQVLLSQVGLIKAVQGVVGQKLLPESPRL